MKHLDLFSGIGGFALACQWNGIETIGFVEIDKYCQKVLRKHWSNVPIVEDIRDVKAIKEIITNTTSERYALGGNRTNRICQEANRQVEVCGIATNDREAIPKQSTLLITAGFPCQPFSVAGKRQGERDDRYLWPQTITVIKAVNPSWVLLENVTGIINLALDTVLSDLEGSGYSTETLVIPACAVNAWHRRDRVWIVGFAPSNGLNDSQAGEGLKSRNQRGKKGEDEVCESERASGVWTNNVAFSQSRESRQQTESEGREDSGRGSQEDVADTTSNRSKTGVSRSDKGQEGNAGEFINGGNETGEYWATEPELGRVAHGISHRVDRLKCLGNAIVPQVAYEIIRAIKEIDGRTVETSL